MRRKKRDEKTSFIVMLIGIVFATLSILNALFFFHFDTVDGHSMDPTLFDTEVLIVNCSAYKMADPKRYDIVIINKGNESIVKRVIALPGETIQIIDGYVYINGEILESDLYSTETILNPGIAEDPITLGEDEYFCMGDNRNHSADSRTKFGIINKKDITSKVVSLSNSNKKISFGTWESPSNVEPAVDSIYDKVTPVTE